MLSYCVSTSFPGSLFSASNSRWNRDPSCGWSRDHLSIQNRRVGGYSSTFGREDHKIPHPSSRFFEKTRFWVVTWPAATTVSVPTTKRGREERPWERGWLRFSFFEDYLDDVTVAKTRKRRLCFDVPHWLSGNWILFLSKHFGTKDK